MKVFVVGCDNAAVALWIIRSLGRRGVDVTFGCDSKKKIAFFSRYIKKHILFDNFRLFPFKFIDSFISELKREKYDLVIPVNDAVIVPIMMNIDKCQKFARIAVPELNSFNKVYDKIQSYTLADRLGIPLPKHKTLITQEDIYTCFFTFKYPIVIKPSRSKVLKDGIIENLNVAIVYSWEEFEKKCLSLLSYGAVSVQAFMRGISICQSFLMRDGEPLEIFQYQRVHQPEFGGGSSYRKSLPVDNNIASYSLKFLNEIKWNGIAMVEYIMGQDNIPYFMEINGRFWGGLPLAIFAGADFPFLLLKMYRGEHVKVSANSYRTNVYVRNIRKDIQYVKNALWNKKFVGQFGRRMSFYEVLKHYVCLLDSNEHVDEFYVKDIKPFMVVLFKLIRSFFVSLCKKIMTVSNDVKVKGMRVVHNRRFIRRKKRKALMHKLHRKGISVLFVCKGNICRSPFAEKLLLKISSNTDTVFSSIASCGLSCKQNNQVEEVAIRSADLFGVSLEDHRPRIISKSMVSSYNVIIAFEVSHALTIASLYSESRKNIFILGVMDNEPSVDIVDPYNKSAVMYKEIYRRIARCLQDIF